MFCIIKALFAWLIMMLIGTNLIGYVVRGLLWSPPSFENNTGRVREFLENESQRLSKANVMMTLFGLVLTASYFFALYFFWNVGLVVSAGLLMVSRLPDLLWEIRTGNKITKANRPKGVVYIMGIVLDWLSLPITWYSLCKWTP